MLPSESDSPDDVLMAKDRRCRPSHSWCQVVLGRKASAAAFSASAATICPTSTHTSRSTSKRTTRLSFVYRKLVRHQVGAGVTPGTFTVEPDLAERWEEPDDTTLVFHLRRGVRWHNKPPVNGRELTAEDVKFSFERYKGGDTPVATR